MQHYTMCIKIYFSELIYLIETNFDSCTLGMAVQVYEAI